jgi:2,4-dienoyl-CoA reductase (NADPH2)
VTSYPHIFTPIRIGKVELPNRVMMGSMHTGLDTREDGPERLAAFYAERARGGVPLVITGGWSPNLEGRISLEPVSFQGADIVSGHRIVTDAVHAAGGRILLQLLHCGRYAFHDTPVAPSPIKSPINRYVPVELTGAQVEQIIVDFETAAALSVEAGYDGIELMGSEGYLITQFLCTRTNQRIDAWGGSLENRSRFALEIIRRTRAAIGSDKILMYRISALDIVDGGLEPDEVVWLARQAEMLGVDCLDTGIGWHEAQVPTIAAAAPRAAFTKHVRAITDAVKIPVVATNRINTPDVAEAVLAAGDADMVSLARPLLADPDFVTKAKAGAPEKVNVCIACNQACLDHYFSHQVSSCLVNPRAGFETEIEITPALSPRNIAVVGAGPAGMAAASTLAERGHRVTLFEASEQIGGQFNYARMIPGKEEFNETLRYFTNRLAEFNVDLKLNKRAEQADLVNFDEVIIATGVNPRRSVIDGEDHLSVASYVDILSGTRKAGDRVVIVGAGGIGFDVAIYLTYGGDKSHLDPEAFAARWGLGQDPVRTFSNRKVTMLQRSPGAMGKRLGKTTGWVHRMELAHAGVKQLSGVHYRKIDDAGLHIEIDGEAQILAADTIVLCAGQVSETGPFADLQAQGAPVHLIGGAKEAGELDAKRAFDQGVRLAANL